MTPPKPEEPREEQTGYDLFISYAQEDRSWVEGFLLDALKTAGVAVHTEEAFTLGRPRLNEFERAVRRSRRVLLVVSPAYLVDDSAGFVDLLAQQFGLDTSTWPVIPLFLKPTDNLPTRISMLTGLDATDPDDWDEVIERLCAELQLPAPAPPARPACPYPGMVPFTTADSHRFYGRDREIQEMLERLRLHPFLTVIGASGSGKSSLVFAGLVPALQESGFFGPQDGREGWLIRDMRPGANPGAALADVLDGDRDSDPAHTTNLLAQHKVARLLLIVDQFEELFTLGSDQVDAFQRTLAELAAVPQIYVVLTVRADFYGDLMSGPLWSQIKTHRLEVTPLGEEQLEAIIVKPADDVQVFVEAALVERLLADAAQEPGVLPLLQETLVLLWEKVERRYLPLRAYESLLVMPRSAYGAGTGVNGRTGLQVAIARRADTTLAALSDAEQTIAQRIFLRLIQFGEGRADTRRQQPVDALRAGGDDPAQFDKVLNHLVDQRMLTLSGGEATDGTERRTRLADIAHEALIVGWPQLRGWIDQRRSAELTRRRLAREAQEWIRLGRGSGGLLDAVELQEAQDWLTSSLAGEMGKDEEVVVLVQASQAALNRARLLRMAVIAVIVLLILGGVGTYALVQRQAADRQRVLNDQIQAKNVEIQAQLDISRSKEVAATARSLLEDGQSQTAMLLSVAAISHITETVEANATLRAALEQWRGVADISGHAERTFVTFSGNGQYMASADESGLVRVWQMVGERKVIDLAGHTDRITALTFAPDSSFLVTASRDGSARSWDPSTGDLLYAPMYQSGSPDDAQEIKSADLNFNDATILVTRGVDNLRVWDLTTGQPLDPDPFTTGADLRSVAVSPTGEFMAAASADGLAGFWQISSRINVQKPGSNLTSFSNDGLYWATISGPTLYLWDMVNGLVEVAIPDREMSANISTLVFSKDGKLLAVGGQDGTIRLWDLRNLGRSARILRGHTEQITSLKFSPDNRFLSSTSLDDTARIWRVETGVQETLLTGHNAQVWSVAFSPDSRQIATSDAQGTIRLWSVQVGGDVVHLEMADAPASDLALMDSEGAGVALAGDGMAQIWRSDIPRVEANLVVPAESEGEIGPQITAIAALPQNATVALGTAEGELLLLQMGSSELLDRQIAHTNGVSRLLAPPWSGGDLLTAGGDGFIRRWHTQFDGNTKIDEWMAHPGGVTDLAVAGELMASTGYDGRIRLWDGTTGQISVTLGLTSTATPTTAPDAATKLPVALAVALSADGRFVAGAGRGAGIFVWDRAAPDDAPTLIPVSAAVRTLAFSPDGSTLASGDESGLLRLWNLASGRAVIVGTRSASWVVRATFSPDGSQLFSLDQAGNARVWPVSTADLVALACTRAIRDLTGAERAEYLPFLAEDLPTCGDLEAVAWTATTELDPPRRTPAYTIGSPLSADQPPRIYYFDSLNGSLVQPGEEIILRWRAENAAAAYLEINGERQGITSPNEMAFTVDTDTLFRLVVENATGERSQTLHVFID